MPRRFDARDAARRVSRKRLCGVTAAAAGIITLRCNAKDTISSPSVRGARAGPTDMNAPVPPRGLRSDSAVIEPPVRLREIPYNYTSFSDREIVIRLLGARGLGACSTAARASAAPAARRACCTRCWATSGSCSAIPTCRTTCSTTRSGARLLIEALHHRLGEIEKRRDARRDARARRDGRRAARGRAQGRAALRSTSSATSATCASARARVLARHTRKDNIKFDGLSRVSHVTDATDWRVEYPFVVLHARHRGRDGRAGAGCIELGLTIIPRGGGTGYTGGAMPLTWKSAVINTEKLEAMTEVEHRVAARASTARCRRSGPRPAW